MRSKQNILMSIIRAQGETLRKIEKDIGAEEDSMKRKCRAGYVNLVLVGSFLSRIKVMIGKCRGSVAVFADEFNRKNRR